MADLDRRSSEGTRDSFLDGKIATPGLAAPFQTLLLAKLHPLNMQYSVKRSRGFLQKPVLWLTASVLGLLGISWLAFFHHLGSNGLVDETEPLFAEAARQMVRTGDWITPFFNGETRFDKPPLIYWLQAINYRLIGVNPWAVRLPSALSALGLVGFCFYTLLHFGDLPNPSYTPSRFRAPGLSRRPQDWFWSCAWLGAAMTALNLETIFWARLGTTDMLLNTCMGIALLAFFWGYGQPERPVQQRRWFWAGYGFLGLAVLAKGPIGVLLPGLIIGSFSLYLGNFRQVFRELRLLRGMVILLVITLPWYFLVTLANGRNFINSFFGYHNLERFAEVVNQHSGPWYFYLVVILAGFAPWSVYLPAAIARLHLLRRHFWRQQPRTAQLGLLAGFWFLVILVFFSIATTKYFSYVLPLIPAAAILVALLWSPVIVGTQRLRQTSWYFRGSLGANLLLGLVLAAIVLYSPNWLGNDQTMPNLGLRLQQVGLNWNGALIWLGCTGIGLLLILSRQARWLWGVNLVAWLAFLWFVLDPALFIVDAERQLPLRQMAQTVTQVERPGEPIMMVGGFKKASLTFYSDRTIRYIQDPQKAKPVLAQLAGNSEDNHSVLLIANRTVLPQIGLKSGQSQPLREAGPYQLVRVSSYHGS